MSEQSDLLLNELVAACVAFGREIEPDWQTRIGKAQEELKAYIAKLEAENERLQNAWFVDETICPDGSLRPKVSTLLERIAELEAEVAELKPFRDGYDPEEVFPPEGEWVWLRDCDDEINPVQYDHKAGIYWNYETNVDGGPFSYWESNNGDLRRWYPIGKLPEA